MHLTSAQLILRSSQNIINIIQLCSPFINLHHLQDPPHKNLSISATPPYSNRRTMAAPVDNVPVNYGFDRPEMFSLEVANSIEVYERHLLLCYKEPASWPFRVEDSVDDRLPYLLNSALKARKDHLPLKTRLTICGGCDGAKCSDGDVLVFPDMVKYKGLKESNVDAFVDDVLVKGEPWSGGIHEPLVGGAYVFVCAHASRDTRCGVCGPVLIEKFKDEIKARGLNDRIFVNVSSHLGGHKYAGNIVIYATNAQGRVTGDWYGYVTPEDVPDLIDLHIGKGEIIKKNWRGQMGLKIESAEERSAMKENTTGCCQGANAVSCCMDVSGNNGGEAEKVTQKRISDKSCKKGDSICLPGWVSKWKQSDVLVAAGVVGAIAATVAVAYSVFRKSS